MRRLEASIRDKGPNIGILHLWHGISLAQPMVVNGLQVVGYDIPSDEVRLNDETQTAVNDAYKAVADDINAADLTDAQKARAKYDVYNALEDLASGKASLEDVMKKYPAAAKYAMKEATNLKQTLSAGKEPYGPKEAYGPPYVPAENAQTKTGVVANKYDEPAGPHIFTKQYLEACAKIDQLEVVQSEKDQIKQDLHKEFMRFTDATPAERDAMLAAYAAPKEKGVIARLWDSVFGAQEAQAAIPAVAPAAFAGGAALARPYKSCR